MVRTSAIDQSLSDAIDVKQHLGRLSQLLERAIMTASAVQVLWWAESCENVGYSRENARVWHFIALGTAKSIINYESDKLNHRRFV